MKDSVEVATFSGAFQKVLDLDLAPSDLATVARDDEVVRKLCSNLHFAGFILGREEKLRRELFASPVDPNFLHRWRDYQARFEGPLTDIWLAGLDFSGLFEESMELPVASRSRLEIDWENADDAAATRANAIESAVDFALDQATQEGRGFPDGFSEEIEDAATAWEEAKKTAGLDLRGIFRRRELIPFVLIPRHVASKYGTEKLSLLTHLRQAHEAFVFGTPLAAIALLRSVMEVVLRKHYSASGTDLEQLIDTCPTLPKAASAPALHVLRRMSNAVLHFNATSRELPDSLVDPKFEQRFVSILLVVRALIEGAPAGNVRGAQR